MKNLIRKIIVWAVKEEYKKQSLNEVIEEKSATERIDFNWHGTRISNLEENVQLLMTHLGVYVRNGKRLETNHGSLGGSELTQAAKSPSKG